jgi:hypothetical protein
MSYSRRQLEALGEPLGESVTRKEGGRIIYGGGGDSAPATQTQVQDLPDWAKPTAQRNLGKAEALTTDKPYQSYGNWARQSGIDPSRVAGFTGLQNQSFQGAQNLQPSQGLRPAMGIAGAGAMGSLGAGQNYMNMATDPGAMQGFMSPYMQNVVDTQQQEAIRQSNIQRQSDQAQAVQRGAFGGSRQAIVEAERQRNLGTQLGGIQAQGLQSAFQNAQQAQQFGANLGLQGYGQAVQGAGQLANIGTQQFGQQKDILGLQNQFGAQQQANEQAKLGYNMQDYAAEQAYPYQQLSFLSNIMRGTPMGGVGTMYGQQPTTAQTIGTLGTAAYGLSQLRAEGGTVSSYADGGSVDSAQNIESIVDKLSDPQLKQAAEAAQMRGDVEQLQIIQQEMAMRASERGGMAGAFNQLPQEQQQQMMAGGGIVAFAGDEDENEDGLGQLVGGMMPTEGNPEVYKKLTGLFPQMLANVAGAKYTPMSDEKYNQAIAKRRTMLEEGAGASPYADIKEKIAAMRGEDEQTLSQGRGLAALQAAAALSQGRGLVQGLGRASGAFAESYGKALQADKAQKRSLMNMEINAADAMRKERMGLNRDAISAADQARKDHDAAQQFGIKKANALASVAGKFASATKPTKAAGSGGPKPLKIAEQLAAAEIEHETNPSDASLNRVNALRRAVAQTKTSDYGPTRAGQVDAGLDVRLGEAITTAQQKLKFTPEYVKATPAEKAQMMRDEATRVRQNAGKNAGVNDNSTQAPGSGTVEGLPAGATVKGDKVYDSSGKLIGHVK